MNRTIISETPKKTGEEVTIAGWVDTKRDHGKITFIDIHDYSGIIQIVGSGETLSQLSPQDVVKVEGLVQKRPESMFNKKIKTGEIEIKCKNLQVLAKSQEMPFDMGQESLDLELPTLLDHRGLTLRHPKIKAIFKVQEVVIDAFRKSLKEKDFTEFQSPVITPQGAEGGAEVFE